MSSRRTLVIQFGLNRASWQSVDERIFVKKTNFPSCAWETAHQRIHRSRSELIPVSHITPTNPYLHILPWWTSCFSFQIFITSINDPRPNRSRKRVTLCHNRVTALLCTRRWIVLECCQLPLSFKRTIITFLFDNYCAMETVDYPDKHT